MIELHHPGQVETIVFLFILALPWLIGIGVCVYLIIRLLKKIPQPYQKWIGLFPVTLVGSTLLVFQTLWMPKTLGDPNEQYHMVCGWPIPYLEFTGLSSPPSYPWTKRCISWELGSFDTSREILWIPFLTNVAFFEGIILVVLSLGYTLVTMRILWQLKLTLHKILSYTINNFSIKQILIVLMPILIGILLLLQYLQNAPQYAKPVGTLQKGKNDKLQQNITSYMEAHKSQYALGKDDYQCSTTLYGYDDKYAYAWVSCMGYIENAKHQRELGSGFGVPVRFEYRLPNYQILNFKQPGDGSQYPPTLRQIFPKEFYNRAMKEPIQ